ncbi:MAG TPA: hypothetical protein VJ992_05955 [Gemmatimonadales bacterium]|nr:hypothetical protein [Gemmatimonadales bacterium]
MRRIAFTLSAMTLATAVPLLAATPPSASALRAYENAYASASAARIPSFSRQTGLACNVCHTTFPQLTPFGRAFKLNGYTLTGMQVVQTGTPSNQSLKLDLIPPVSAMVQTAYTSTKKEVPGTQNGDMQFPQQLSLFLGEEITPRLGTFLQLTFDPASGTIAMDNADIRYANHAQLGGKDFIYGFTLNNNPTVSDVFNSTPAWGYPYAGPDVSPAPSAGTLIDGALGQQVAGLGAYGFFNKLIYAEFALYRSAQWGGAQPPDGTSEGVVHGVAPYWRVALQHDWGQNSLEVGTFGMRTDMYPTGVSGPYDRYTDVAVDGQYERIGELGSFTAHGLWINEDRTYTASQALGVTNSSGAVLHTLRLDASYYTPQRIGFTAGYFNTSGDSDVVLYAPDPIDGSANGSPNSNGFIGQLSYMPWLNTRFAIQYTLYNKFNGGSTNYDGSGRSASDNNTLYLLAWLVF